ncbi:YutD family protein [Staphylococcus intermedius]|uniref:Cytosolic protein n=1 Tax=Staphylococcus intermedius NCTC 11048 TaxID=1141106 RepID=A0A380GAW7_STAIN|nr:YutD-like domain-containing protein [Staphylococcus intermedius]PCF65380.1 hypothetical protein B5C04_04830 [Staphylococcus intermedius]PCF81058.1 hypothetical protein B4W74_05180 [Staphylococcus intermedius]PCF82340.1 hypothetical protein B4W70_04825 [Staphylococcus intermedius]PCF87040.1 hypothetical protein B4W75_08095 [Staphylococcus intermedius]PCF87601.1 hypothetical protein B4W76_04215 [Staphylococcus intermedius]
MIKVGNHYFELLTSYKDGFNEDDFIARYSEILDKYDFVVGDYGYDQLRLKGFYHDSYKKADFNKRFSTIQDYLYEYCNFGCAYFVLRRLSKAEVEQQLGLDTPIDATDKLKDVKIQPTIQD